MSPHGVPDAAGFILFAQVRRGFTDSDASRRRRTSRPAAATNGVRGPLPVPATKTISTRRSGERGSRTTSRPGDENHLNAPQQRTRFTDSLGVRGPLRVPATKNISTGRSSERVSPTASRPGDENHLNAPQQRTRFTDSLASRRRKPSQRAAAANAFHRQPRVPATGRGLLSASRVTATETRHNHPAPAVWLRAGFIHAEGSLKELDMLAFFPESFLREL